MKPVLTYVSLFSGIEACSVAMSRIEEVEWRPVFFSEIDPFASAVLAHHFPDVPNLGDICKIKIDNNTASNHDTTVTLPRMGVDLLAGGSPCQDVSVAGKRAGMQDGSGTRSSLAFEYARLVEELRPRIILWENVPGVLSSNGGRDFGAFLHSLAQLGYCLAWRVLDVQHTRVDGFPGATPQRRRRVWLVGCLGDDGQVPAEILFERPGLLGDSPPSREAGKGFAAPAGYGPPRNDRVVGSGRATPFARLKRNPPIFCDGGASRTLTSHTVMDAGMEDLVVSASFDGTDCAPTLHRPNGSPGYSDEEVVCQAVGFSHSNSNTSIQTKPTPECSMTLRSVPTGEGAAVISVDRLNQSTAEEVMHTIKDNCSTGDGGPTVSIGFKAGQSANGGLGEEAEVSPTMSHQPSALEPTVAIGVSFDGRKDAPVIPECAHTECVGTNPGFKNGVAIGLNVCTSPRFPDGGAKEESAGTLAATQDQSLVLRHIVRRLTPTEAERLQAFPDGWTRIPYRGKPADQCPDSPRYKALGNSWGTNCAEWILRRIVAAFRLGMI